jgi:hypothetical protein
MAVRALFFLFFPAPALNGATSGLARRRHVLGCRREPHHAPPSQAPLARQGARVPQCGPTRVGRLARRLRLVRTAVECRGRAHKAVRLCGRRSDLPVRPRARGAQLWRAARRTRFGRRAERGAGRHRARVFVTISAPT